MYEKLAHEVVATPALIEEALTRPDARTHAVIAELDGAPVGMALYFYNFSTFLGRHGIYIEDLFVLPDKRGHGIGKKLLAHLAAKAVAGKASAAGLKAVVGHHGHHTLARKVVEKAVERIVDPGVHAAFARDQQKDEKRE